MITDDSSKKSEVLGLLCIRIGRLCRVKDQPDPLSRKIIGIELKWRGQMEHA